MKRIICLCFVAIIFSGCTFPVNYYIRNLTNKPIEVSLYKKEEFDVQSFEFFYVNKVIDVKYNSFKKFTASIQEKCKNNEVKVKLLPNSTYFIGHGTNFNQLFKKAIVHRITGADTVNLTGIENLKFSKSLLLKYAVWFDIE